MNLRKLAPFFIVSLFFIISLESLADNRKGSILITDAWVRPSHVENSAAYMTIENTGNTLDQLIGAQTDVCEKVELHRIERMQGVFRMRHVKAIDIPAETRTVLKPAGMHLMLMKLKQPLKIGKKIALQLNFRKAGSITVETEVRQAHSQSIHTKEDLSQKDQKGASEGPSFEE